MLSLAPQKDKSNGFVDLHQWGFPVDPGVIVCKDGSLLAGWYYAPADLASATDTDQNWRAERVGAALERLDSGWTAWIEACRIEATGYPDKSLMHFPDPISEAIDDERRELFEAPGEHHETRYAVFLSYMPPSRRHTFISDLFYSGGDGNLNEARGALVEFRRGLASFEAEMSSAVEMSRMREFTVTDFNGVEHHRSELVNFLEYEVLGEPCSIDLPPAGNCLDHVLGNVDFLPGSFPLLGGNYVAVLRIAGFPAGSWPTILSGLEVLPFPLRFSSRYVALDRAEGEKAARKVFNKWSQKVRGLLPDFLKVEGATDLDASDMKAEAAQALKRSSHPREGTGYYTPVVVLMHPDPDVVQARASQVKKLLGRLGFRAEIETDNAPEALMGSLAGHTLPNIRRPPIHTDNLADLFPLTTPWRGQATVSSPYYPPGSPAIMVVDTDGGNPFNLNLLIGDQGNTLVFGPPGTGKSTLLGTISLQFLRYRGASVWGWEKGRTMLAACKAVGGRHVDFGNSTAPRMCPLSELDDHEDLAAAAEWVTAAFVLQIGREPDTGERDAIFEALRLMAEPEGERTITHFIAMVQSQTVRDAMRFYSIKGPYGWLFDAEHDDLIGESYFNLFETSDLLSMGEAVAFPALVHMFRKFKKSLHGQPVLMVLDELWSMLEHKYAREKVREFLKTLRKENVIVLAATQSISDAHRSGILDVLLETCPNRIFGANPAAADSTGSMEAPGPREFYTMLGLNDAEIELVRTGVPKRDYYLTTPIGKRPFYLRLGPKALALVGRGSKEDIDSVNRMESEHGREWVNHWFRQVGAAA